MRDKLGSDYSPESAISMFIQAYVSMPPLDEAIFTKNKGLADQ